MVEGSVQNSARINEQIQGNAATRAMNTMCGRRGGGLVAAGIDVERQRERRWRERYAR